MPKICRMFSSLSIARPTSRRRGVAGVGLGLAVVERIVSVFGGNITAESEPGRRTRFVLGLEEVTEPRSIPGHAQPTWAVS